jgi:hypothetical protein
VQVAEDLLADAQHHRPMPADQDSECGLGNFIAMTRESRQ